MKRMYLLKGLHCPNCAAKIEAEIATLPGVTSASVNLMNETLAVETHEDGSLLEQIAAIVHAHEPDVEVSEKNDSKPTTASEKHFPSMVVRLIVGAVLFAVGIVLSMWEALPLAVTLALMIAAYAILGWDVIVGAVKGIVKGRMLDENFLMSVSSLCAFAIGEYHEAVAVMLFYQVGEYFQDLAVRRSRRSITELMDIRPDTAVVWRQGTYITVSPDEVAVGEQLLIKAGDRVPLDATVIEGTSTLDVRALTGESAPKHVSKGDTVLSGSINQSGVLTVRADKAFGDSTASKIIDLVEHAASKKAPSEQFITVFARYYTPVVVALAALLAIVPPLVWGGFSEWLERACVFLVISCPCALVLSVPLTFFSGIGAASRHGILIKGGNYLEALSKADTVVFDKTGTLTKGDFCVTDIVPASGFSKDQLLMLAASAEQFSTHPIAVSLLAAVPDTAALFPVETHETVPGKGIRAAINGHTVSVGNRTFLEEQGVVVAPHDANGGTTVYVVGDGVFVGRITLGDTLKPDSHRAITALKNSGVRRTVMLTGDNADTAAHVAQELGIDDWHADLLPHEKVQVLETIDQSRNGTTVFVGDGINDAPVLARADIGVAMGGVGSDAAIEAADVVLMTDEPSKLAQGIALARATKRIVVQNIVFALGVKAVLLVLGAFGIAGMWVAVFGDVGVALLAVLNAMRMLKK